MTDPMKELFDNLNQSTPAPKQQAENKAVFLATAHRMSVTSEGDKRHQRVNTHITTGDLPMKFRFNRKRMSVIVVLFATLMVAGGVLANSIFNFFSQADSDNTHLQVTVSTLDANQFVLNNNAKLPTFFDNLAQALASTPYHAKAPQSLPAGYRFINATYDEQTYELNLYYQCGSSGFTISQGPFTEGQSFGGIEVGASANVIPVNLGDGGQYVRGGWSTVDGTSAPAIDWNHTTQANIDLVWSNEIPQHNLLWILGPIHYSYTVNISPTDTACSLSQEDIIAIAQSMR